MAGKERRRTERYPTASIPVQLSDVNGELIDLSMTGAAVIHRSPVRSGAACTLVFPSHGGFYIPCQVLRSVVQVLRAASGPEYVFRSAIHFSPKRLHNSPGAISSFHFWNCGWFSNRPQTE